MISLPRFKVLICCCFFVFLYSCKKEADVENVSLSLNTSQQILALPNRFIGLSYEMTEITAPSDFSSNNTTLIQLIKTLGNGVIRIGGSGVDHTYWDNNSRTLLSPNNSITTTDIDRFAAFDKQTGWPVIFGLNLKDYNTATAANEAEYVANKLGSNLLDFEIGNEPDMYKQFGYRSSDYTYNKFKGEFDAYTKAIRKVVPNAPVCGPDISHTLSWASSFANDEKNNSKLLTAHHYGMSPYHDPSINELLSSEASLQDYCQQLKQSAFANGMSYRIAECNSVYSGGVMGISNTFASALWGLDMMWTIASCGGDGVNFHGGNNGAYTPIALLNGSYTPRPIYYGIMAFKEGAFGHVIALNADMHGLNIKAYATIAADSSLWLTVINKTVSNTVTMQVNTGRSANKLEVKRLMAPSLDATDGVIFAGSAVNQDGTFTPSDVEHYFEDKNIFTLNLPAASAVVVHIE